MGFLRSVAEIEAWLDDSAEDWHGLRNREFIDFWNGWRSVFESALARRKWDAKDIDAMVRIEQELPFDAVVFCSPGYKYLPSGTISQAYAYRVTHLTRLDRELLNYFDAVVADSALRFTCIYTHEAGLLADVIFLSAGTRS